MTNSRQLIDQVLSSGRNAMDEYEGNRLLSQYDIPMAETVLCNDVDQALEAAEGMGYPVVMKIVSPDILHKTEAGCVRIGIRDASELREAYETIIQNAQQYKADAEIRGVLVQEMLNPGLELIFGVKKDPQFGHVILFGAGGIYVEIIRDISLRLVPIKVRDAVKMIDETMLSTIFAGARGKKYSKDTVVTILMALSRIVQEHPMIEEIDINPFILYEDGKISKGVDAVVVIAEK
ncbi:MAG TPA: acetyl-CoA synthetase [Tissierellia bacterium]|nr:acetyl-CoA synthetase [Tissierellia bacterium]